MTPPIALLSASNDFRRLLYMLSSLGFCLTLSNYYEKLTLLIELILWSRCLAKD